MGAYSTALSGLDADGIAFDVIGNNLANLNTTGFKGSDLSFQDLMNQTLSDGTTQAGEGVSGPITEQQFTQGSITATNGPFDGAIQGNGFFVLQNTNGQTLYTRAGDFSVNATGQLVTATGQLVQGWTAANGVVNTNGPLVNIAIPTNALLTPVPTANLSMNLNLDAAGVVGQADGTFSAPIQVDDSLGEPHTLTATFTKTAANTWSYNVTVPGADVTGGTAGTPSSVATGSLTFDSNGNLTSPAAGSPVALAITGLADGAADLNINWNLYDASGNPTITQFAQTSALAGTTQDGVASAQVTSVAMANGGTIVANYSDGTQQVVGQVAMASIANPESLIAIGNNSYELGGDTATPAVGASGTGTRGTIQAGSLEASNVDIATQFTNLIVFQQSYEANSKVINTLEQVDQALFAIQS
jgi:flagellar hook protein FlgE